MYTKSSGVEKFSKGCANEAFAARTTTVFVKPPLNHLSVTENSKKKGTTHSRKHNQVVLYRLKTQSISDALSFSF